jgi:hypothetical protein
MCKHTCVCKTVTTEPFMFHGSKCSDCHPLGCQTVCMSSIWLAQTSLLFLSPPSVLNNHIPGNLTHIHSQILSLIISTLETDTKFFSQMSLSTYKTTSCHKPEHCNLKHWPRLKKCFLSYEIFHNVKLNIYILGYYLVKIYHAQQHQLVSPNCTLLHSVDEVCSSAQCENLCEKIYSLNKNLDNINFYNCHSDLLLHFILCKCIRVTPQRPYLQTLTKPIINQI